MKNSSKFKIKNSKRNVLPFAFLIFNFVFLTACQKYYYNPAPQVLPSYIRKIAVRPFANQTQQYGLEDKLTLAVQSQFNQDGRYQITTEEQADGVVIGNITRYIVEPLSWDANHVPTQYKLWILTDLTFYDKVKNQTLFREPNMEGMLTYYASTSGLPGSMTEVEAQQTIWDQLSRDVLTRTIEGFGTVTGASEKVVPKSSPSENSNTPPEPGPPAAPSPLPIPY